MKWISIFLLCIADQSYCMHNALREAIKQNNLHKVQKLLAQINHKVEPSESEPIQSQSIDFSELQQLAAQLTAEHQALTEHRSHPAVYNRMLMGSGTIVISLLAVGNYFYQAISTKQYDFQSLCAAAVAGGTAIVHGCKEISIGIQNQDAKDAHAHHLAITHLLLNAQSKQESEAIV